MSDDHDALARLSQLAAVGELAASTAHETRNVLTGILGFAQLAREQPADGAAHAERIYRDATRCIGLLDRLLRLAREADEPRAAVDAADVVAHVAGATTHALGLKRIELRVAYGAGVRPVDARRGDLQQLLLNLVLNASQAMGEGGSVTIAARGVPGGVEVAVEDTGPGIPAALRERVFARYFTTRAEGTGLGLPLCRSLAERNGGTLVLDEGYGPGARFVLTLPPWEAG
ncbi:MAG TPA: HAMP domain-containing sensor histidine kinase [Kofleriaceae bacterium]|jgi:signal transduction histidine kinase